MRTGTLACPCPLPALHLLDEVTATFVGWLLVRTEGHQVPRHVPPALTHRETLFSMTSASILFHLDCGRQLLNGPRTCWDLQSCVICDWNWPSDLLLHRMGCHFHDAVTKTAFTLSHCLLLFVCSCCKDTSCPAVTALGEPPPPSCPAKDSQLQLMANKEQKEEQRPSPQHLQGPESYPQPPEFTWETFPYLSSLKRTEGQPTPRLQLLRH